MDRKKRCEQQGIMDPGEVGGSLRDLTTRLADNLDIFAERLAGPALNALTDAAPDDLSRLERKDCCVPPQVFWHPRSSGVQLPANAEDGVLAEPVYWASWIKAKRDGLPALELLINANLCGHRIFYLGCYEGDSGPLLDAYNYYVEGYARRARDDGDYDGLIVTGDGKRRWLFSGTPWLDEQRLWWESVCRILGSIKALWVIHVACCDIHESRDARSEILSTCLLPGLLRGRVDLQQRTGGNPGTVDAAARRSAGCGPMPAILCSRIRVLSCADAVYLDHAILDASLTSGIVSERLTQRFRDAYPDATTEYLHAFLPDKVSVDQVAETRVLQGDATSR